MLGWLALATGCATVTGSETQPILFETHEAQGGAVAGAHCWIHNNNGSWTVTTPGTVHVRKSAQDLVVRCELGDRPAGTAWVVSQVNAGMFGNVIIGGAIGAAIDHTKGTAYDYPDVVRVVFGATRIVEMQAIMASPPPAASTAAVAGTAVTAPGTHAAPGLPNPGTMWRYSYVDRKYARTRQQFTVRATQVSGTTVQDMLEAATSPMQVATIQAREPRFVQRALAADQSLLELAPYLVSATWPAVQTAVETPMGYPDPTASTPWSVSVTPPDWESITVPAGTFKALRVHVKGTRGFTDFRRVLEPSRFEYVVWYVPEIGRYAMIRHLAQTEAGPVVDQTVELLEYKRP